MKKIIYFIFQFLLFCPLIIKGQDISLFEQINGRYDFTFIGNTMNSAENNPTFGYITGTTSSADLNLSPSDNREGIFEKGIVPGHRSNLVFVNNQKNSAHRVAAQRRADHQPHLVAY